MSKPHTCPTCEGRKVHGLAGDECPTCEGAGVVWEPAGGNEEARRQERVDDPLDLTYRR